MPVTYPLDTTGVNPANLVQDELHSVNEAQFRDYYFIVPTFTPFYVDNFQLVLIESGVERVLEEDVDFSFALPYVTATRTYGKQLYAAITLHNLNSSGILKLRYQTLGGEEIADRLSVLAILAEKAYNPRTTIFDLIVDRPNALPPTPHPLDYDDLYGQEEVVNALVGIRDAIAENSSLTVAEIRNFLMSIGAAAVAGYIKKVGDEMLGPLILSMPATEDNHAVNRLFVLENTVSPTALAETLSLYATSAMLDNVSDAKVSRSGSTMSGPLILSSNPAEDMQASTKQYVDNTVSGLQATIQSLQQSVSSIAAGGISREEVLDLIGRLSARIDQV